MIASWEKLKFVLNNDKKIYIRTTFIGCFFDKLLCRENVVIWSYVKTMRYCEYWTNNKHISIFHNIIYFYYLRKYNKKSIQLGLIIGASAFDEGLTIYHTGNIVVNGYSKIGKNCKLHGDNCIGNSKTNDDCPTIGDNVRLCVGAKVIGDIYIANNVTVAAGAVVVKSCYDKGALLVGVPAKIINK